MNDNGQYIVSFRQACSVSLANTLKAGVSLSTTNSAQSDIFGVSASAGTTSASAQFNQQADTSSSVAVTKSRTFTITAPGVANDNLGVHHGYDRIFIWLNPKMSVTTTSSPNVLRWNGYAYDSRDPVRNIDYVYVTPLQIDTDTIPAGVQLSLQRSWSPELGSVTSADLQTIKARDPFATNPSYDPNNDQSGGMSLRRIRPFFTSRPDRARTLPSPVRNQSRGRRRLRGGGHSGFLRGQLRHRHEHE
jgi:hypothetical protein